MAESSAVLSLRESFGDRKLPDITRKITACVACRKQKVPRVKYGRLSVDFRADQVPYEWLE
jgi:hypothetical protein